MVHKLVNTLKPTELYTFKENFVVVNYISRKIQ